MTGQFFIQLVDAAQNEADATGCTLMTNSCDSDSAKQITALENFISAGCDAIIVCAVDSEAAKQEIITDDDGTYYKKISIAESQMNQGVDSTDKYVIKVRFPKENDTNAEYSDLIEYIKLDLSAKQIID